MKRIATLTMNPSVDLTMAVEQVLPTRKLRCDHPRRDPGGGGINVARAFHELGGTVIAVFPAGGPTGLFLKEILRRTGIEFDDVEFKSLTRESFSINETSTGRQFRFVLPGPVLTVEEWESSLRKITGLDPAPDYVVASGSLPRGVPDDFYARLAAILKGSETRMILDTSGEPLRIALEEGVYLVKPNLEELAELAGQDLEEPAAQEQACRELIDRGAAEVVALTMGSDGALLVSRNDTFRLPAIQVEVKSAVGAGDSFVGGLTLGLVRNWPLREAFCLGMAAGTSALIAPGTELCRRKDTEEYFRQICTRAPGLLG
ncbi:MAG: 1-phosphofructokinase family hexose kinase [Desulfobacteraceae bacterium]|nr:1-phosphofructokinase family hexose kinase [Desulfobacteraceae bacterium]